MFSKLITFQSSLTAAEQNRFRMTGGFGVLLDIIKIGINNFNSCQSKKSSVNTFELPEKLAITHNILKVI